MNNPLKQFELLAQRARLESVPQLDVSQNVLRAIRVQDGREDNAMLIFAGFSLSAAAAAALYCISVINALYDPLADMFQVLPVILS